MLRIEGIVAGARDANRSFVRSNAASPSTVIRSASLEYSLLLPCVVSSPVP